MHRCYNYTRVTVFPNVIVNNVQISIAVGHTHTQHTHPLKISRHTLMPTPVPPFPLYNISRAAIVNEQSTSK